MKKKTLLSLAAVCMLASGCVTMVDMSKVPLDTPEGRDQFFNKNLGTTMGFSIKAENLQGKKAAIVSFTGDWTYESTHWGDDKDLAVVLNIMADSLRKHFEADAGLTMLPFDEVTNNKAYKDLSYKAPSKEGQLKTRSTAYGLKDITLGLKPPTGKMQELAKALGVDYVFTVFNSVLIKGKGEIKPQFQTVQVYGYDAKEARIIWYLSMPAVMQMIDVPTSAVVKKTWGFYETKYEVKFGEAIVGIPAVFEKLAQAIALKFKKDRGS